jgi:hypothetical protein
MEALAASVEGAESKQRRCDKRDAQRYLRYGQAARHSAAGQGGSLRRADRKHAVRVHRSVGYAQAGGLQRGQARCGGSRVDQRAGNDGGSRNAGCGDRELHVERRRQQVAAVGGLVRK